METSKRVEPSYRQMTHSIGRPEEVFDEFHLFAAYPGLGTDVVFDWLFHCSRVRALIKLLTSARLSFTEIIYD